MGGASSGAGDGGGADIVSNQHGAPMKVAPKRKKNIIERTGTGEVIGNIAAKHNTWRRERYIKKNKLENKMTSMDEAYLVSPAGRKELDRVSKGDYQKSITAPRDDTAHEDGDNNNILTAPKPDFRSPGFSDGTPPDKIKPNGPTTAEIDQSTATKSADETLLATNKKGRTSNILTNSKGLGDNNLIIKKRKLG